MWAAMSPPPPMLPPSSYSIPGTHTTTEKNPDGSSTVYVHHINHGAAAPSAPAPPPQVQMPQMFGVPYPMPMPMPTPAPMYSPYPAYPPPPPSSFGCPYPQQPPHQQPRVIVISDEPPKPQPKKEEKKEEKKKEEKKKEPPMPIPIPPPPPPPQTVMMDKDLESESEYMGPQQFSKFSITSVIMFFVALAFSIVCVIKTYEAFDQYEAGVDTRQEEYSVIRTVAIATGGASVLAFTIATFCSFYAGMRHRHHGAGDGHCCLDGFIIAGWVIYCIAFINDLIILVLAFDEDNVIYPEVVWSALIVSIFAWMLMFGFSEIARRG